MPKKNAAVVVEEQVNTGEVETNGEVESEGGEGEETTTPVAPVPATPVKSGAKERKPKYAEIRTKIAVGENAIDSDDCKKWLGWQEETVAIKFGTDYLTRDANNTKIRCLHNARNRPFYSENCESLIQEHLNKRWRFNGEPIIIGKYGTILNGQHSLISLIMANQIRFSEGQKEHWDTIHGEDNPITMDKVVIFGVEETDEVVNTMDTCRPRSYADVLYRSDVYGTAKGTERKTLCKMSEWAVKMAWHRTGAVDNPFAPKRTHSEGVTFLHNHPHLKEAVLHIYEENQTEKEEGQPAGKPPISKYISPGYASGLLYLMAASGTTDEQAEVYRADGQVLREVNIDMSRWEQACEFWVNLAKSPSFDAVREALGRLADPSTGAGGRREEKEAVLAKAWNVFVTGKDPKLSDLKLKYQTDKDGISVLKDDASQHFGGIDLGPGEHETTDDEDATQEGEEDIEARKAQVKEESLNSTLDTPEEEEVFVNEIGEQVVSEEDAVFNQFDTSSEEEVMAEEETTHQPKNGKGKKPLLMDVEVPTPGSGPKKGKGKKGKQTAS